MEVYLQGGPFNGETSDVDQDQPLRLLVNERYMPGGSYAHAVYRPMKQEHYKFTKFTGFEAVLNDYIEIDCWDGPCVGSVKLYAVDCIYRMPFRAAGKHIMDVVGVGVYELCHVPFPQGRQWGLVCRGVDQSPSGIEAAKEALRERLRVSALRSLYRQQGTITYSHVEGEHKQVEVVVGYRWGCVDEGIVPLIQELWRLGMDTIASCQERPQEWGDAGMAYIEFARNKHALAFRDYLKTLGIETRHKQTTWESKNPTDAMEWDGGRVTFDRTAIAMLTEQFSRMTEPPATN